MSDATNNMRRKEEMEELEIARERQRDSGTAKLIADISRIVGIRAPKLYFVAVNYPEKYPDEDRFDTYENEETALLEFQNIVTGLYRNRPTDKVVVSCGCVAADVTFLPK